MKNQTITYECMYCHVYRNESTEQLKSHSQISTRDMYLVKLFTDAAVKHNPLEIIPLCLRKVSKILEARNLIDRGFLSFERENFLFYLI